MTATILLADDHPLVRHGLRNLLESEPGFSVVGEAEDGIQVLQMIEKIKPNVLIVDLMMPNLNGLEVLKQTTRRQPDIRKIVLSMQSADAYILEAFRSGAIGYVLKDSAPDELVYAVRQSLEGHKYLSPKLPKRLISPLAESVGVPAEDPYETLTEREREVYQMVAEGKTSNEIAKILSISPRTAEIHRSRLMNKLSCHNRAELVRDAVKRGILPLDT